MSGLSVLCLNSLFIKNSTSRLNISISKSSNINPVKITLQQSISPLSNQSEAATVLAKQTENSKIASATSHINHTPQNRIRSTYKTIYTEINLHLECPRAPRKTLSTHLLYLRKPPQTDFPATCPESFPASFQQFCKQEKSARREMGENIKIPMSAGCNISTDVNIPRARRKQTRKGKVCLERQVRECKQIRQKKHCSFYCFQLYLIFTLHQNDTKNFLIIAPLFGSQLFYG